MPLLDHFRPPVSHRGPWESVNSYWIAAIGRWLNRTLPKGRYQARIQIHLGPQVEADVAEFEHVPGNGAPPEDGGVATLVEVETAVATVPAVFPDTFAVEVVDRTDFNRLVGVVELVSPANKKEASERDNFLGKCMAYLNKGVGLVVIDVVTERRANLHNELLRRLGWDRPAALLPEEPLYAAGYGPVRRQARNLVDLWPKALALGQPLPPVPFHLRGGPTIPLDLEGTYTEALADSGY